MPSVTIFFFFPSGSRSNQDRAASNRVLDGQDRDHHLPGWPAHTRSPRPNPRARFVGQERPHPFARPSRLILAGRCLGDGPARGLQAGPGWLNSAIVCSSGTPHSPARLPDEARVEQSHALLDLLTMVALVVGQPRSLFESSSSAQLGCCIAVCICELRPLLRHVLLPDLASMTDVHVSLSPPRIRVVS